MEGETGTLSPALISSITKVERSTREIWADLDDQRSEVVSLVNQRSQKCRLASFETTDAFLTLPPLKFPVSFVTEDKRPELTADETFELGAVEKQPLRKDSKRLTAKGNEKFKGKIKKLKGFWNAKLRVPPHIFKWLYTEEDDIFELQDLSMKGPAGGRSEAGESRPGELSDCPFEEPALD